MVVLEVVHLGGIGLVGFPPLRIKLESLHFSLVSISWVGALPGPFDITPMVLLINFRFEVLLALLFLLQNLKFSLPGELFPPAVSIFGQALASLLLHVCITLPYSNYFLYSYLY